LHEIADVCDTAIYCTAVCLVSKVSGNYNLANFEYFNLDMFALTHLHYYAPPRGAWALSDDARLTSVCLTSDVCLSRTSGLSREQRGLGRLKLAQR